MKHKRDFGVDDDDGIKENVSKKSKREEEEEEEEKHLVISIMPLTSELTIVTENDNIIVSTLLGVNLFIHPPTVLAISIYLVAHYTNNKLPPIKWMPDMIRGILQNPISIYYTCYKGMPSNKSMSRSYITCLRLIGSDLHQIPFEFFRVQPQMDSLLECLSYTVDPDNSCFLRYNPDGIRGELIIENFRYNNILMTLFDPVFLIVSCYFVFLNRLFHHMTTIPINEKRNIIREIIKPLTEETDDHPLYSFVIRCIGDGRESKERIEMIKKELNTLYMIMLDNNYDKIYREIKEFWSERASKSSDSYLNHVKRTIKCLC